MWGEADEAVLFEVRHDVADGRGRKAESRLAGQRARPDGLAVAHVALDQRAQELLRPVVRLPVGAACRVRHKSLLQKENGKRVGRGDQTSNRARRVSRIVARDPARVLKSLQTRMNKHFSRIALVGKVEDARVADSLALLADALCARWT